MTSSRLSMTHMLSVLLATALSPTIIGGQEGIKHVMEGEEYLVNTKVFGKLFFRIFHLHGFFSRFQEKETLRLLEVYVLKYLKISSKAVIKAKATIEVFMIFPVKILRN